MGRTVTREISSEVGDLIISILTSGAGKGVGDGDGNDNVQNTSDSSEKACVFSLAVAGRVVAFADGIPTVGGSSRDGGSHEGQGEGSDNRLELHFC